MAAVMSMRKKLPQKAEASMVHAGQRLRRLRKKSGETLDKVAAATGMTKSFLSKIERGLSVPSISTALKLANKFDVDVGVLFSDGQSSAEVCVTRRDERAPLKKGPPESDESYVGEIIAANHAGKRMFPFVLRPPFVLADPVSLAEHEGDEFVFVLKGKIEVVFSGYSEHLQEGDSIYFDATIPHKLRSSGTERAEILVTVYDEPAVSRSRPGAGDKLRVAISKSNRLKRNR